MAGTREATAGGMGVAEVAAVATICRRGSGGGGGVVPATDGVEVGSEAGKGERLDDL